MQKKFKNRRKQVKQRETVRIEFLEVAKLILVAMVVIAGVWAVKQVETIPIKTIEVQSSLSKVDKSEIKMIAHEFMHEGFFTVDLPKFENRLNNIPWIYRATIKRKWPGRLVISVEEQQPYFRWGQQHLINKYAEVFFVGDVEAYAQYPLLVGTRGREKQIIELYYKYNEGFKALGTEIVIFKEDARYDKELTLSDGININLGRGQTDESIKRCLNSFAMFTKAERKAIKRIDMRHSNGFAVRWNS